LLGRLAEAAAAVLGTRQTFAVLCDRSTGQLELASLRALAHTPQVRGLLQNYRAPQPGCGTVAISSDVISVPGLWMIPVTHDSRTEAFAGVLNRSGDRPALDHVESLRALSRVAGPFIAALRDAQGLRRKVEELEAHHLIKSSMVSHLSHELRSLLAAVRGYAKRMADGRAGALGDAAHHHLDVILRNTGKLLDLASHTLPFVAEQVLRIESFDLREPLENVLKRMQRGEPEQFATITLQIPAEPFLVTGDRERLAVVFGILLSTATASAAAGAKTTIQFLRGATEEMTVKIFAGRELPQSVVDSIFEHHDEAASPLAPQGEVGAPGFSLVHDLIWLHGGRISVTSRSGEGAVFLFTLPPGQPGLKVQTKTGKT
jgi:signal transduction histidine kinase